MGPLVVQFSTAHVAQQAEGTPKIFCTASGARPIALLRNKSHPVTPTLYTQTHKIGSSDASVPLLGTPQNCAQSLCLDVSLLLRAD